MIRKRYILIILFYLIIMNLLQANDSQQSPRTFPVDALQQDFQRFREILEQEHCCTYEYTSKAEMDSLFDTHYDLIDHDKTIYEFFQLLAPITAKIGCMHTSTWLPVRYFRTKPRNMFPLTVKLIDEKLVVLGSYNDSLEVPTGSILLHINGTPVDSIIADLQLITPADAMNPYFIDSQLSHRFSQFYTSMYGLPDGYEVTYIKPGTSDPTTKNLTPTDDPSVREIVFRHFSNPPLEFEILEDENSAILTVYTFAYYTRVEYFQSFMDSCFSKIKEKKIENLILDLRGNSGGDPFCPTILLSYLESEPVPYFAERYGKYSDFADPIPLAENHFTGNLYTLIDGICGSTNGHFCALLDYNNIGTFIGTPSGATYKCNAGKNTELLLPNTQMIITIGRTTYSAAVENMDKAEPIIPDILVHETADDIAVGRDVFMEAALKEIQKNK